MRANLSVEEQQVFENWLSSLTGEQAKAWGQDVRELASLIGLDFVAGGAWEQDKARGPAFQYLSRHLWMLHQMGYPLPVLQSLREGKGPASQP